MSTKMDLRQTRYVGTLDQLSSSPNPEGDNLLESINSDLSSLLRMSASSPVDLTISVDGGDITNPESNRRRAIPHVGAAYVEFTSGTITLPAADAGTITITPGNNNTLNCPTGNYAKLLVYLDGNGDLNVVQTAPDPVLANVTLPPPPDETLALGYVIVQNVAGTIQNITQNNVVQFGIGSGGGGTGNADAILETIKNYMIDSFFELATPNIFKSDKDAKIDTVNSTGAYNLVDRAFTFSSAGQTLISIDMLDPEEFLSNANPLNDIELLAFWRLADIDTAATYEVSRNGGLEWQAITMERVGSTEIYRGILKLEEEAADQSLISNATGASNLELDDTSRQRLSQKFTLSSKSTIRSVDLDLTKVGSPAGYLMVSIVKDDGSDKPSLLSQDVLSESAPVAMSSISTGTNNVEIPEITLAPDDYHIVLRTVGYTATYVAATTSLQWDADNAASAPFMTSYDGSAWTEETNFQAKFDLQGIELDLRVRITSSAGDKKLEGYALFYDKTVSAKVADGQINVQVFEFDGALDETEFVLTKFTPHPDLLKAYDVNSGQVYTYGAFSLDGQKVIFEAGQFLNPGETVKLRFMQVEGAVFDTSDVNGLLLASNHLGSTDASIDRSIAGRGIFLRRPDGTLRELTIDNDDNIDIKSVP